MLIFSVVGADIEEKQNWLDSAVRGCSLYTFPSGISGGPKVREIYFMWQIRGLFPIRANCMGCQNLQKYIAKIIY